MDYRTSTHNAHVGIKRRRKALLPGVVAISLVVAACGAAGEDDANEDGITTITYWDFIDPNGEGPREEAIRANLDAFHDEHPNIEVDLNIIAWPEIPGQLIQAVPSGSGPDVVRILDSDLPQQVDAGTLEPIDEYWDALPEERREDFLVDPDKFVIDGERYGVFMENRVALLQYREDLFDDVGVEAPTTWDEVETTSEALVEVTDAPFVLGFSEARNAASLNETLPALIWSTGGEIFNEDGTAAFHEPDSIQAFEWLASLVDQGHMPTDTVSYHIDQLQTATQSGEIGMTLLGNYRIGGIRTADAVADVWQSAPMPGQDGPSPALVRGWSLAMPRGGENPDAAWEFIDFMTGEEGQANLAQGGEMPAIDSVFESFEGDEELEEMQMWRDYVTEYGRPLDFPADWNELLILWAQALQQMSLADAPAEEAVGNAAEQWNMIVAG